MFKTREDWLNALAEAMAPWFAELGCPLPRFRVAIGFPSTGRRGRRIGECWDGRASADSTFEIFIRPDLDDPMEIAATEAHELTHAAVGLDKKHGPAFRRVALAIGLTGKMNATVAGDAFKQRVAPILERLGPIPHARLSLGLSSGPKKQTTRLLKCECPTCGYTVRTARKWLEEMGAPHCPRHGAMRADVADLDMFDDEADGAELELAEAA